MAARTGQHSERGHSPVSRNELEHRERQRATPEPHLKLSPPGMEAARSERLRQDWNERRISFIRQRLGAQERHAVRDFHRSR